SHALDHKPATTYPATKQNASATKTTNLDPVIYFSPVRNDVPMSRFCAESRAPAPQMAGTVLAQERRARFLPGVDAALDVTGGRETRILCGLHRHGRAFPEGAVENDALAGGAGEFIEHAAGPDIGREIGVGSVQRAGNDAVLVAFAALPQVDERHVGPAVERKGLGGAHRPAAPRNLFL